LSVRVFYDNTNFRLKRSGKIRAFVSEIILAENRNCEKLAYIFTTDEDLKKINVQFLNHNYFTDVITFDYSEDPVINGEVYMSIDRIRENARAYSVKIEDEILRVMFHGVLHLTGYNDISEVEKKVMRAREDYWLAKFRSYSDGKKV
jgi:probable rRNA maturation factor